MTGGPRWLAWALFAVWAAWLSALQSLVADGTGGAEGGGRFTPELGLVLSLAVLSRAEPRDLPWVAALLALARGAFAVDPLPAVLVGGVAVLGFAVAVRSVVETTGVLLRTSLAAVATFAFDLWLIAVREVELAGGDSGSLGALLRARLLEPGPAALASAACALVAGGALARLPGLTPLRSRSW